MRPPAGVHRLADVAASAAIGPGASVGPFVSIGDGARIGARTIVHPHVDDRSGRADWRRLRRFTHACRSASGWKSGTGSSSRTAPCWGATASASPGRPAGTHHKIPQVGGVVIEDDVEIGANATIDRPAVGETRIGAGTKIDNLVQIAHGVTIGSGVLLAAQVGIAGSSTIEDGVTLAGQVGVAGHLTIGART